MSNALVKEVLNCLPGETLELDLKHVNFDQAIDFVTKAFQDELLISKMPKITLIVGAGKEQRQKYDQDLPKWVESTLKSLNYSEDNGSFASFDFQATFKYQHDTNKNLKLIVVFPKAKEVNEETSVEKVREKVQTGDVFNKPAEFTEYEWLILVSELDTFEKIVTLKIPTWTLKKRCKELFDKVLVLQKEIEEKLAKLKVLTESEQKMYENIQSLSEKRVCLIKSMKKVAASGEITSEEKKQVVMNLEQALEKNISVEAIKDKLKRRLDKTKVIEPKSEFEVRKFSPEVEVKLKKLLIELIQLQSLKLEEKAGAKGLWSTKLSSTEVSQLKRQQELEKELNEMLQDKENIFYFETEAELREKFEDLRKGIKQDVAKLQKNVKSLGSNGGWNQVGSTNKKQTTDWSKMSKKEPNTGRFQAFNS